MTRFRTGWSRIFARVQASSTHTGRTYSQEPCPVREPDKLVALRQDIEKERNLLKDAVAREDYEEAARIRDRVHGLEAEMAQLRDDAETRPEGEVTDA